MASATITGAMSVLLAFLFVTGCDNEVDRPSAPNADAAEAGELLGGDADAQTTRAAPTQILDGAAHETGTSLDAMKPVLDGSFDGPAAASDGPLDSSVAELDGSTPQDATPRYADSGVTLTTVSGDKQTVKQWIRLPSPLVVKVTKVTSMGEQNLFVTVTFEVDGDTSRPVAMRRTADARGIAAWSPDVPSQAGAGVGTPAYQSATPCAESGCMNVWSEGYFATAGKKTVIARTEGAPPVTFTVNVTPNDNPYDGVYRCTKSDGTVEQVYSVAGQLIQRVPIWHGSAASSDPYGHGTISDVGVMQYGYRVSLGKSESASVLLSIDGDGVASGIGEVSYSPIASSNMFPPATIACARKL